VAVARHDLDKVRSSGRERLPFLVRVRDGQGQLHDLQAWAVVDASGTWTQPNPLGASGLPALGEIDAGSQIVYGLPDIAGRGRLATDLADLVDAGRIELISGFRIHAVERTGNQVWLSGDQWRGDDLADIRSLRVVAHQVIAATGFRPDHSIAAELRLALEPALESAPRWDAQAVCAVNRTLLARAATTPPPLQAAMATPDDGTAADWSAASCCAGPGPF
jgi:hypothetical protein